jgi:hypothetical protein
MSNPNSQVSNYVDFLIVETLSSDTGLSKFAQAPPSMMDAIIGKIKGYVSNNVDPNDKAGSVLNMLAPGLISATFGALGLGKIGLLAGLIARMFHLDLAGIFRSIWNGLKGELSGGKQTTSDQVHNIVQNAIQENSTSTSAPATEPSPALADDGVMTVARQLRRAQIFKASLNNYEKSGKLFTYAAKPSVSMLSQILSFIFRVIISSAGLMVAGDAMNHFLGRPNAIDNPIRGGKPVGENTAPVPDSSRQTLFPLNPSYQDTVKNSNSNTWTEDITNNTDSISQMLQNFAKDVYQGLSGHEADIQSSPHFQNLVHTIAWYNHANPGEALVFIPKAFATKKQLVDQFIDDVAAKSPSTPQTGDMKTYKV